LNSLLILLPKAGQLRFKLSGVKNMNIGVEANRDQIPAVLVAVIGLKINAKFIRNNFSVGSISNELSLDHSLGRRNHHVYPLGRAGLLGRPLLSLRILKY
jgi:hypothetical protein